MDSDEQKPCDQPEDETSNKTVAKLETGKVHVHSSIIHSSDIRRKSWHSKRQFCYLFPVKTWLLSNCMTRKCVAFTEPLSVIQIYTLIFSFRDFFRALFFVSCFGCLVCLITRRHKWREMWEWMISRIVTIIIAQGPVVQSPIKLILR